MINNYPNPFLTKDRVSHLVAHFKLFFKEEITEEEANTKLTALWSNFVKLMCEAYKSIKWDEKDVINYLNTMRWHLDRDHYFIYLYAYKLSIYSKGNMTFYAAGTPDPDVDYQRIIAGFNNFDGDWVVNTHFINIGTSNNRKKERIAYNLNNNEMFFFIRRTKHRRP